MTGRVGSRVKNPDPVPSVSSNTVTWCYLPFLQSRDLSVGRSLVCLRSLCLRHGKDKRPQQFLMLMTHAPETGARKLASVSGAGFSR